MKCIFPLLVAVPFWAGFLHAQTQADLERQVQAEQWADAAKTVDALMLTNASDVILGGYREEIYKHLSAAKATNSAAASTPPAGVPVAEAPLKGADKLEWNTLLLMVGDAQNAPSVDDRKKAMAEYLEKSTAFVAKHPDYLKAWQFRAVAALELDKAQQGLEAGLKLKALGALDSEDPAMMKLMANLNRKQWLDETAVDRIREEAKAAAVANLRRTFWQGSWQNKNGNTTQTLAVDADHVTFTYNEVGYAGNGNWSQRYTIPGEAAYSYNYDYDNDVYHKHSHNSGSGRVEMLNYHASDDAQWLTFESRGSINVSGTESSVISLDGFYVFYYDPAVKDALIRLYGDDTKLSPEDMRSKARLLLVSPTNSAYLYQRITPPVMGGYLGMLHALADAGDPAAVYELNKIAEKAAADKAAADKFETMKGKDLKLPLNDAVDMELVWVPAGYWVGKYEVTQGEFAAVMGTNASRHVIGERQPVDECTWYDATNFCKKVTDKLHGEGFFPSGFSVTLPTKKQWEYYVGDATPEQAVYMNYRYKGKLVELEKEKYLKMWDKLDTEKLFVIGPKAVGSLKPNQFGLYDVLGNVDEWTVTAETLYTCRTGYWRCGGNCYALDVSVGRGNCPSEPQVGYYAGFRVVVTQSKSAPQ